MELIYMILAFLSGILGTFLGGVRSFVIYGIIGLICFLLPIVGFQVPIVCMCVSIDGRRSRCTKCRDQT